MTNYLFLREPVGLLEKAAKWESMGEHGKAVECYLNIQASSMVDKDTAIKCWLKVSSAILLLDHFQAERLFKLFSSLVVRPVAKVLVRTQNPERGSDHRSQTY